MAWGKGEGKSEKAGGERTTVAVKKNKAERVVANGVLGALCELGPTVPVLRE